MTTVEHDDEETHFAELRETAKIMRTLNARRFASILHDATGENPAIDFLDEFEIDDYCVMTIGRWGGYLIQVTPMLFNDRIVMTPDVPGGAYGYDHGWCYDKGGAAFLAAAVWNPQTEAEPAGYKKRATHGLRQAGDQADHDSMDNGLIALLSLYGLLPEQQN